MLSKKMGARLFLLLMAATLSTVVLAACEDNSEVITLEFTIRNETEYEIQEILFVEQTGKYNKWIFLTIVGVDEQPLSAGEERQVTVSASEKKLSREENKKGREWYVSIEASEAVRRYDYRALEINKDVVGFVITYSEETEFVFAPFYQ